MVKCAVCNKKRSELDMRPLVNVDELELANGLAEAGDKDGVEATREVAGSELQVVCRRCWVDILQGMDKDAVIEQMETLCGLLFEMERQKLEQALERTIIIEKERETVPNPAPAWPFGGPLTPTPGSPWAPNPGPYSDPHRTDGYWRPTQIWCHSGGTAGSALTGGTGGTFTANAAFDAGRTMGTARWSGANLPPDDDELGAPARAAS